MPNRIIKESVCRSDTIAQLSWFEEVCWYRLIVSCDDLGRMDARPAILKATMFPLVDVTHSALTNAIKKLASIGMIILYSADDGKPYLFLPTWSEHQRIRDTKPKYPGPSAADCGDLRRIAADCGDLRLARAESESESESISESVIPPYCPPVGDDVRDEPAASISKPTLTKAQEARFGRFWNVYPRKESKEAARKAWKKLNPDDELTDAIIAAVCRAKDKDTRFREVQFTPHPATWLNAQGWTDELTTAKPRAALPKSVRAPDNQRKYSAEELERIGVDLLNYSRSG